MLTRILMPQLGESVAEGIVGRWLKKVGDWVNKDEPLVEVVTDKVTAEIPSAVSGVLTQIVAEEGATVEVGHELAMIDEKVQSKVEASRPKETAPGTGPAAIRPHQEVHAASENGETHRTSPLVRRLAAEHGINLAEIQGSGQGGRITRDDVLGFLNRQPPPPEAKIDRKGREREEAPDAGQNEEVITLTPMRRTIAQRMAQSAATAPHVSTVMEVDMTGIVRLRELMKEDFHKREGADLTYVPFVIRAVIGALKEYPVLNSSWGEDRIVIKKYINLGIAVALEDGLIVPVIRRADEKSLAGLAKAVDDLSRRAKAGKLAVADVQGGTFTVNNTGAFGSIVSTPIINQPQAAIITMEAIVKRPVVVDDAIAIRSMMNLCLSFDHRILDGMTAGRFLQSVKRRLEHFDPDEAK